MNSDKIVDSFHNGVINIITMWILSLGISLMISFSYGDMFLICAAIVVTISHVLWLIGHISTKCSKQVVYYKNIENIIDIQNKIAIYKKIVNKVDLIKLCDNIIDTIDWIVDNNCISNKTLIDQKTHQLMSDAVEVEVKCKYSFNN